ncbi:hypothetical protein CgunFtcFv8_026181 [Champsocephalus gunnari]|uniref:PABC domain-containing protein n=1 Tax=Champsocephalus gunnari TaxID=52237 RepID=A0AAN8CFQ5_CHAGU|nr:hypothetical protein CgunFtcFv8_026181 [Champsocephalus gunnari]
MDEAEDLETLGEKLYSLIYPKHKEKAGKLTGMLLELPRPVLGLMLQDKASLNAAVEKALGALQRAQEPSRVPCKEEDEVSASSDSVGEQLFELVDVFNTGHSQKITGMLLEQHKDAVLHLLSDPHLLEEQVTFALKTLQEQNMEETDVSDWSDAEDTERLGGEDILSGGGAGPSACSWHHRYAAGDGARCSPSTAQQPHPAAGSCSESSSSPAPTEPNSLHLNKGSI